MSADRDRVVVTGLGATTPLGGDVASTWAAMLAGKSGVRRLPDDLAADLPVKIAARIAIDPASVISPVQMRSIDRTAQLALTAARQAWQDAGPPEVRPERLSVSIATGIGSMGSVLEAQDKLRNKGWRRLSPYTIPMLMPNGPAAVVGIELGARASTHGFVSESGADAIGYGIELIRSGRADVVVAGGTEASILPLNIAAFALTQALSTRNDEPERACRPFDKGSDGFVLAEGAGVIVLESGSHAARRNATVYAIVAGVGYSACTCDPLRPEPCGEAMAFAMRGALADAHAAPDHVVHVNAHADSTPIGDKAEIIAIRKAFGDAAQGLSVSATKSMTGHLLAGAGPVESIATICALRDAVAPPTINLENPDDDLSEAGLHVAAEPLELTTHAGRAVALNNSSGLGRRNVALAFVAA